MAETKSKPKLKPLSKTRGAEAWTEPTLTTTARTKISGANLVPKDIKAITSSVYTYWIGLTSDCPCATLDAGGIRFPMAEELIDPDPARKGQTLRRPVIGKIHPLREDQILAIIEELPRLMIRTLPGKQAGPVKGYGVRIPTKKEIEIARNLHRPLPAYVARKDDVPAARYMYAVLCPDQDNPTRGLHYPPSLEEIGIEWPDELE